MLNELKNSKILYRQWRNLNVICPNRLTESWRTTSNNLIDEYELFCSSLVHLTSKQDPATNPNMNLASGLTMLDFKYQKSQDVSEFIIVPKLQSISSIHNPNFTSHPEDSPPALVALFRKQKKLDIGTSKPSRNTMVHNNWILRDANLIAEYEFNPFSINLLKVPKSFWESSYAITLPNIPQRVADNKSIDDILSQIQFSSLVSEPLMISYSTEQEEYNTVILGEYTETLRRYNSEHLPAYQKASYEREKAVADYMELHQCKEMNVPASEVPRRVMPPIAPVCPPIPSPTTYVTLAEWNQNNLMDGLPALSLGVLIELYDNFFSDVDISRILSLLSTTLDGSVEEWIYLEPSELQLKLNTDEMLSWQYSAVSKYLLASSNSHLRSTNLGVKLKCGK